jgi:CHAT domain-containing protein
MEFDEAVRNYIEQIFRISTNNQQERLDLIKNSIYNLSVKSKFLIEPVTKYIVDKEIICIIPFGILHLIPFHTIYYNGNYLIKNHRIVYSPSLSLLKYMNLNKKPHTTCCSFGLANKNDHTDPVGKYIVSEAKSVANIFNEIPFLYPTKKELIDIINSNNKDILHFSCHGFFSGLDPLLSGLVISNKNKKNNNFLHAWEVFGLKISSTLVTLSACETGIIDIKAGDELMGFIRSFLYVGVKNLVVSQWPANASATKELMKTFYNLIKEEKLDVAYALQKAQVKMIEEGHRNNSMISHPYYWGSFKVIGGL